MRCMRCCATLAPALTLSALACPGADTAVKAAQGIAASIDAQTGHYENR
jgi:hypothetical protein